MKPNILLLASNSSHLPAPRSHCQFPKSWGHCRGADGKCALHQLKSFLLNWDGAATDQNLAYHENIRVQGHGWQTEIKETFS